MYGYICPYCGDHLDPGERCECREEAVESMHVPANSLRYCGRCESDTYPDNRLDIVDREVICGECRNDEMGGHYDI